MQGGIVILEIIYECSVYYFWEKVEEQYERKPTLCL